LILLFLFTVRQTWIAKEQFCDIRIPFHGLCTSRYAASIPGTGLTLLTLSCSAHPCRVLLTSCRVLLSLSCSARAGLFCSSRPPPFQNAQVYICCVAFDLLSLSCILFVLPSFCMPSFCMPYCNPSWLVLLDLQVIQMEDTDDPKRWQEIFVRAPRPQEPSLPHVPTKVRLAQQINAGEASSRTPLSIPLPTYKRKTSEDVSRENQAELLSRPTKRMRPLGESTIIMTGLLWLSCECSPPGKPSSDWAFLSREVQDGLYVLRRRTSST